MRIVRKEPHPLLGETGISRSFGVGDLKWLMARSGHSDTPIWEVLEALGIDTKKGVYHDMCKYRSMIDKKVVYGQVLRGTERMDEEWLKSGLCSDDNRMLINSGGDIDKLKDFISLNSVVCFTQLYLESF